jgi:hypothetical protein
MINEHESMLLYQDGFSTGCSPVSEPLTLKIIDRPVGFAYNGVIHGAL